MTVRERQTGNPNPAQPEFVSANGKGAVPVERQKVAKLDELVELPRDAFRVVDELTDLVESGRNPKTGDIQIVEIGRRAMMVWNRGDKVFVFETLAHHTHGKMRRLVVMFLVAAMGGTVATAIPLVVRWLAMSFEALRWLS